MLYYNQKGEGSPVSAEAKATEGPRGFPNQKKGESKMPPIDLTNMSAHAIVDRKTRFAVIENSIGWGNPVIVAPDKKGRDATATLTDTGVLVIRGSDNMIITAFIATVRQAQAVWNRGKGGKMPQALWNMINYNNNTDYWKNLVAA